MKKYKNVILETSIKPFKDLSLEGIKRTVECYCINWANLIEYSEEVSILLWVSDGNEIYEWRGDYNEELICADSIGFCNYENEDMLMYNPDIVHYRVNKAVPYAENPRCVTFVDLKNIITAFKSILSSRFNKSVRVGATVDPGPEFAPCRFKIEKHREILLPDNLEIPLKMRFMTHQAVLKQDNETYAGFPEGIPEGTSFGSFLGCQFEACRNGLGFDYIWFSNGFAYTHYPWDYRGEVFNGREFDGEKVECELKLLEKFWSDFRRECPDARIEVRGSNFSLGMDISSDACSHDLIMEKGAPAMPPCNPPWGSRALGLEMCSFLTRIAKPYTEDILFRFYLNDPWFACTPWYDYYARETFDIYTPAAVARLESDGSVRTANSLSLLSVDTEKGELITSQALESIPHFIRTVDEMPDAPGPFIWIYPHDEYHDILDNRKDMLNLPFMHDWFITQSINSGLSLNTVVSSDVFADLAEKNIIPDAVYIVPVPQKGWKYERALISYIKNGGRVFFYGPVRFASEEMLELLGLELADKGLEGEFETDIYFSSDVFHEEPRDDFIDDPNKAAVGVNADTGLDSEIDISKSRLFRHLAVSSGGKLLAVEKGKGHCNNLRAALVQNGKKRIYALHRIENEWDGGKLSWIRGTVHFNPDKPKAQEPEFESPVGNILCNDWMRRMLCDFNWDIKNTRISENNPAAMVFIKRFDNAFYFTGHKPDTTVNFTIKTPYGAPVYHESQTLIKDGCAIDHFGRSFYSEVRVFVEMENGVVSCKELPVPAGMQRQISVTGLKNANLAIFPSKGCCPYLRSSIYSDELIDAKSSRENIYYVKNYSGTIYISW